ncbi:hypothetical protein D3C71_1312030 [compost metagenome]
MLRADGLRRYAVVECFEANQAVVDEAEQGVAEDRGDATEHQGLLTGTVQRQVAVGRRDQRNDVGGQRLAFRHVGDFLHGHQCGHGQDVRHQVGHYREVDEGVELLAQVGTDGEQGQCGLCGEQHQHADNRGTCLVGLGEDRQEVTGVCRAFVHLSDGELPTQQRADAGKHHGRHHDVTDHRGEHLREHQAERRGGRDQFFVADDTEDDVGGDDVDHRCTQGAAQHGNRYVALRVFHRVGVGASRFQAQEGPQGDRHRGARRFEPALVMRVPASGVDAAVEIEPAHRGHQHHWCNHPPDGDRADPAGNARAAKVGEGRDPQQGNGRETDLQ